MSDLMHGAIALAGELPTAPDWTVVDSESALREGDELERTGLICRSLDDETLARPVTIAGALAAMDDHTGQTVQGPPSGDTGEAIAIAREVPEYETFIA